MSRSLKAFLLGLSLQLAVVRGDAKSESTTSHTAAEGMEGVKGGDDTPSPTVVEGVEGVNGGEHPVDQLAILLHRFDNDKDGKLSMAEIMSHHDKHDDEAKEAIAEAFKASLKEKGEGSDDLISIEELLSSMEHELPTDAEGVQGVEGGEHPMDQLETLLHRFDNDKDGKLSMAEIMSHHDKHDDEVKEAIAEAFEAGLRDSGKASGDLIEIEELLSSMESGEDSVDDPATILRRFDADKDGKLSLAEIMAKHEEHDASEEVKKAVAAAFKAAVEDSDKHSDGLISVEDLLSSMEL